ncbi:MAG TPA: fused MFS/spermidine synthase [Xanthobacteraceae bacterium]|nr:fused MFS/spermidine synthase [Xanthobacteraceae bacterium]
MQAASRHALVRVLFIATVFVSAALLFAVQPMFTKMVLPRLGGAPAVWSVAMVFFQTALLAGYAYAHGLTRLTTPRIGAAIHLAVMIAAVFALPLAIAPGWGGAPQRGEAVWLIGLFAASIGLPFFALAANGPLLQAWFARTDHPLAANPYFLYAASNVGSFLALIAYPFAVEPLTRLSDQSRAWSVVFGVLIVLIAACGVVFVLAARRRPAEPAPPAAPPSARNAIAWMGLAAVPAGLLVSVTAHISTDIGAVPLLWVVPLALYLATFVIVFQSRPIIPHWLVLLVEPFFLVGLVAVLILPVARNILLLIAINLAAFFVIALTCHGELARRRPPAEHLTAFYLWMAAGGMIGGLCAALIAPLVFNWIAEYPLLLVLAALCRPGLTFPLGRREWTLIACAAALALYLATPALGFSFDVEERTFQIVVGGLLLLAIAIELFAWQAPLAFAALIAISFMLSRLYETGNERRESVRSFFGVLKITQGSGYRVLLHGTTIHGAERVADIMAGPDDPKPEPITYYHANSALTRALEAARARKGEPMRVAVVGLGTGTFVCWAEPGDSWRIYEIDPAVVRITAEQQRFTFLARCAPQTPIVMGDARLKLAEAPDGAYDFIMVDAFSSDTIPVHLLTREAMQVYAAKLAPHGVVAMHVSNRHLELASVVAGIAQANGLVARTNPGTADDEHEDDADYKFTSTIVIVARADEDFGVLGGTDDFAWPVEKAPPGQRIWTDDYSNIIGAIVRHMRD